MHTVFIQKPGSQSPIKPEGVVILDPATGQPATPQPSVLDSTGSAMNPDACAHTYAYTNGLLTTDTATDGANTWVKTYSYTAGVLTGETKWVRQ